MNRILSLAGAVLALAFASVSNAASIEGSIGFNGTPVFNGATVATSTGISSYSFAFVAPGQQFGDYSAVPNFLPVTFSAFNFSDASINPLWSFSSGGKNYSFVATSFTAAYDGFANVWTVGGLGTAKITGFDDTVGTFNFSAGAQGQSFTFLSNAAVPANVPEGGATAALLGMSLVVVGLVARRRAA